MTAKARSKADWTKVAPEDMTNDQLAQAATAIRTAVDAQAGITNNLNAAWIAVQGQINARFNTSLPGVPPISAQAPYPAEFVAEHDWHDDTVTDAS